MEVQENPREIREGEQRRFKAFQMVDISAFRRQFFVGKWT